MANYTEEFRALLKDAGTSRISSSAYDTAWVARLGVLDGQLAEGAVEWLRERQLPDGGWGDADTLYGHDRFICTLAAMVALAKRGGEGLRLERAREALEVHTRKLRWDPAGATVGFEMIVPTLVAEAEDLGVIARSTLHDPLLQGMARARAAKLRALAGRRITRFVTPAFSAEMVGTETELLDADNLQDANGSVGCSPAATTFFALHVRRRDPAALKYLHEIALNEDGGVPYVVPIDVFEHAWVLWNLVLVGSDTLGNEALARCQPHLDFLRNNWTPGEGIASVAGLGFKDGDATSVTYEVLTRYGQVVDVAGVLSYEQEDRFRCYPLEANASTSTNIHVLGALRAAGCGMGHPSVQKALGFLWRSRTGRLFWFDKWHSSPYYPTSHAMTALASCEGAMAREMASDALCWIRETQNRDGSWGFYNQGTAEETAYALQALAVWKRNGGKVADEVLRRGAAWLAEHSELPYPPLWIGKCLYCPELVVRSAILSALVLTTR